MNNEMIQYLETQKQEQFTFQGKNKFELVLELIEDIGHPDPHIRDELLYPSIAHLLHDNHLNEDELTAVLDKLIGPEYLTFDMDNINKNSVLIRSFTVLQLVILVHVHNRDNLIHPKHILRLANEFAHYFQHETILTGYDEEVGFIHTIAHSADLYAQLFKVKSFDETIFRTMLNTIQNKFKISHYYFSHDEDERMVTAVMNALETHTLGNGFCRSWVSLMATYKKPSTYPESYYIKNNVRNFLRSFFFRLRGNERYEKLRDHIEHVLKEQVTLR